MIIAFLGELILSFKCFEFPQRIVSMIGKRNKTCSQWTFGRHSKYLQNVIVTVEKHFLKCCNFKKLSGHHYVYFKNYLQLQNTSLRVESSTAVLEIICYFIKVKGTREKITTTPIFKRNIQPANLKVLLKAPLITSKN